MIEKAKDIFESNTMYYIIVPLFIALVGWIKNLYDTINKNAKLDNWEIEYEKVCPFLDVAHTMFLHIGIEYLIVVRLFLFLKIYEYRIVVTVIGFLFCLMIIRIDLKKDKIKLEFLKFKKTKIFIIVMLIVIVYIPLTCIKNIKYLVIWLALLGLWFVLVYVFSDKVIICDKCYANIYISGGMKIEKVRVDTIKRRGNWIRFQKLENGDAKEIKMKKDLLERIDYFGEPLIIVINRRK